MLVAYVQHGIGDQQDDGHVRTHNGLRIMGRRVGDRLWRSTKNVIEAGLLNFGRGYLISILIFLVLAIGGMMSA